MIKSRFQKLRKLNTTLSADICAIDKYFIETLRDAGIPESDRVQARIEGRLVMARNRMVHGED